MGLFRGPWETEFYRCHRKAVSPKLKHFIYSLHSEFGIFGFFDERTAMSTRSFWALVIALVFLIPPSLASAQKTKPADRGPWEISAFMGSFDDDYEFDPDEGVYFLDPDQNIQFGAGLAYHFPLGLSVGLDARYFPWDMRPVGGGVIDLDSYYFSGLLGYTLPLHDRVDLYAVGGATSAYWSPEVGDSEMDFGFTYGAGTRLYLLENLALVGDFRMFQIPSALEDVTQEATQYSADETFWGYSFSGGISYFFGSKDSDGDGVSDEDDACPDTPRGVEVDARGCPVDSDGDGVADYQDNCPDTPAGARVDSQGCPTDGDGDGVYDGLDRCPDTPRGAEVDDRGCALDSDNDGVPNGIDECPDTPRGDRVDSRGCTIPEPEPEPEPRTFTFEDINFEFDSAVLTEDGKDNLQAIGDTLMSIEGARILLEGHTDSIGTDEYNMDLGQRRAESVRDFLVETFTPLQASQFTIRSQGESQPIASNDTDEGRAQNRRVEIEVMRR